MHSLQINLRRVLVTTILALLILQSCENRTKITENENNINDTDILIFKNNPNGENLSNEAQNLPIEVLKFVPTDHSLLDSATGDLNLDGIQDLVLILKRNGEDTLSNVIDHPEKRPLLLLIRDANDQLTLARRNNNIVYCIDCGGTMGDPYVGLTIKDGYFSIEHYGGSSWRWSRTITCKYDNKAKEWYVYKDHSESFHASDPEKVEYKTKTAKDIGKVKFADFDIYKE